MGELVEPREPRRLKPAVLALSLGLVPVCDGACLRGPCLGGLFSHTSGRYGG